MTLVSAPFEHSCCEHQFVAASQLNEQNVLLATALFSNAQAPGGSCFIAFAEAAEKLAGKAIMPAKNATFITDITRILVPRSKFCPPAPYAATFYIATGPPQGIGDPSLFASD